MDEDVTALVPGVQLAGQVVGELLDVGAGVQAHDIILGEVAAELLMAGQGRKDLGRRERDVEEEAHPLPAAETAQLARQRDQMVVVDPEQVVVAQERLQGCGEARVHLSVGGVGMRIEAREVDAVMADRP